MNTAPSLRDFGLLIVLGPSLLATSLAAEVDPRTRPVPAAPRATASPAAVPDPALAGSSRGSTAGSPRPPAGSAAATAPSPAGISKGTSVGRLLGRLLPDENVRSHVSVRTAFRDVVAPASQSTVRVVADDQPASLGVIIRADGFILTKASEATGKKLECILPGSRRLPAVRLAARDDLDLAILRVRAQGLPVVRWSDAPAPLVGSWLATASLDGDPAGIGVVSTGLHESPPPRPVLGVRFEPQLEGVMVVSVTAGSGAARAGIRLGDVITRANGEPLVGPHTLSDLIRQMQPGQQLRLSIRRGDGSLEVTARLGDGSRPGQPEQVELMDSLGGPLSRRRSGFPAVLQHDTILRPRDCGGPVVDLDGNVVGINIARVSRVATYALPSELVRTAVGEMLTSTLVNASRDAQPVAANP